MLARMPIVRALICGVLLGPLSCGSGDGAVAVVVDNGQLTVVAVSDCPRCDDDSFSNAFGRFAFFSNVTGATARAIVQICGFSTVGGKNGSNGQNLQIAGCGGGVELAFVSNDFSAFAVRSGYGGSFASNIRIGDPFGDVLAADPGFVPVDPRTLVRDDGVTRIEANFDTNLRLSELVVGRGFVR